MHRDIKSENILLTNNDVLKLTDFGSAKFSIEDTISGIGTCSFMAPEIIKR